MSIIIIADKARHTAGIHQLFQEYLQWANAQVYKEFGVRFDLDELVKTTMQHLDSFMPPQGRVLLGYAGDDLAGIACLKELAPGIGEVKRMYVRPSARNQGLGRALLERLLEESRQIGYQRVRLDSARFMHQAHSLYRAAGFREIGEYEGSEIPPEFRSHWMFMEKELRPEPAVLSK